MPDLVTRKLSALNTSVVFLKDFLMFFDLDIRFLLLVVWPILVTVLTQIIKVVIKMVRTGRLDAQEYYAWGGFPSSHIALVSSLATITGLIAGIQSIEFALALALAVLVTRDAIGLRMFVQKNSEAINQLRLLLPKDKRRLISVQPNRVGHTPIEGVGGAFFGIGLTLLLYWLLISF
ncbi:MAG: divergent PAP2 family protein [bacterium]|nr:divergent PAP2 family protein [bacterium]